ncbi:hypothetical protein LJR130_001062 [Variovorax sp. LjRoot130]|uniref:hypothetical protein n=1 Tax=Variovorax sp. LjRoot130 TaxID=3342261 RepID=UPI003ECC9E99
MSEQPDNKAFATLAAQYALLGHELRRETCADGTVRYHAARWGLIRPLADGDAVRAFLAAIGGAT